MSGKQRSFCSGARLHRRGAGRGAAANDAHAGRDARPAPTETPAPAETESPDTLTINGTSDTIIGLSDRLTREQAATIIQRTATVLGINLPDGDIPFTDSISDWALDGVRHCYAAGIMNGYDDTNFGAKDNYTYDQALITVYRLYQYAVANG